MGVIYKHDMLVYGISQCMTDAKTKHTIEPGNLLDGTYKKPADINAFLTSDENMTALDISVTTCTKPSITVANWLDTNSCKKYS